MKDTKKISFLLLFFLLIQGILILDLLRFAKVDELKNQSFLKSKIKTDRNYVLYSENLKISIKDLNDSLVLYKNTTLKLDNNKLKLIANFGLNSINDAEKNKILTILKDIKKAKKVSKIDKEFEKDKNPIIVSGKNFYIHIYKQGKCYLYEVTNNNKTIKKYLKYCKGE